LGVSSKCSGCGGEGFGLAARRRDPNIAAAGYDGLDNEAASPKTRRPEDFRGKGRLAALLLSRRPTRGILLPRALPASLFLKNRIPDHFEDTP